MTGLSGDRILCGRCPRPASPSPAGARRSARRARSSTSRRASRTRRAACATSPRFAGRAASTARGPHRPGAPAGRSTPVAYGSLRSSAGRIPHRLQPRRLEHPCDSNLALELSNPTAGAVSPELGREGAAVVHKTGGSTPGRGVLSFDKLARPARDAGAPPQSSNPDAKGTLAEGLRAARGRACGRREAGGAEEHRGQTHRLNPRLRPSYLKSSTTTGSQSRSARSAPGGSSGTSPTRRVWRNAPR